MVGRRWFALAALVMFSTACNNDDGARQTNADGVTTTTTIEEAPEPVPLGEADQPVVIGHRGVPVEHPDNTLEGFEAAAALGADWVELDVRFSSDGVAVLSHDPETEAGTIVTEATSDELADEGLTTLADALEVIEEAEVGVDVEIKGLPTEDDYDPTLAVVDESVRIIESAGLTVPVLVSSFNPAIIDRAQELGRDEIDTVQILPAAGNPAEIGGRLVEGGHDGVALGNDEAPIDLDAVGAYLGQDLVVWAWTVNDPEEAQELVDAGVEGIITDDPAAISDALGV